MHCALETLGGRTQLSGLEPIGGRPWDRNIVGEKLAQLRMEGGHRTVQISPPAPELLLVVNNQRGRASWVAPVRWRISSSAKKPRGGGHSPSETNAACLSLGEEMLSLLEEGIRGIGRNEGDYSVGATLSRERLWFWWWP